MISLDLAVNAIVSGLLLGGFYAAVTVGVTISFGMLDIVNISHPVFIMLGSFVAYILNSSFGLDPILIGVVTAPVFFLVGMAVYQIYYYAFERRGEESIQGLAFYFGLLFVGEPLDRLDRKSTRLNSSHRTISYAVFCLKKKKKTTNT